MPALTLDQLHPARIVWGLLVGCGVALCAVMSSPPGWIVFRRRALQYAVPSAFVGLSTFARTPNGLPGATAIATVIAATVAAGALLPVIARWGPSAATLVLTGSVV